MFPIGDRADVDEIGLYLSRVFGIELGDLGRTAEGNWLGEARTKNRDALRHRTEDILRERKVGGIAELSPNIAAQILTLGQDESRPALIELWARLLANAIDPSRNNARLSFIETVRQMDPEDAVLIRRMVHKGYEAVHEQDEPVAFNEVAVPLLASELGLAEDAVIVSLEHLEDLGILADDSSDSVWRTTSFGREFFRACYRYRPSRA